MGVADNMSYKDMYHFNQGRRYTPSDLPSLNVDPEVTSTIKENKETFNVEVEGGEIILKPDLSGLHKAVGKKHSRGGMNVDLEPDSFVFSDHRSLNFKKSDFETFDLKESKKRTPAEVVRKNVDVEHYNRLINNIMDEKKDAIAKRSSILMLEKYIDTLGNIAYIQEAKKGFPQELPGFVNPTPVDQSINAKMEKVTQYAKKGGTIHNPYRMQPGGLADWTPLMTPQNGVLQTTANPFAPIEIIPSQERYIDKDGNYVTKTEAFKMAKQAGVKSPKSIGLSKASGMSSPETIPSLWSEPNMNIPQRPADIPVAASAPTSGNPYTQVQAGKSANWKFTPWQKESMFYNLLGWANTRREMPMRSQMLPSYADPRLVNPQQLVGSMQAGLSTAQRAASTLNPYLAQTSNMQSYGQYLDKVPEVWSQYDNQNVGILNSFAAQNNQIANNARQTNIGLDQNYWKEAVEGRKNFDNMRNFMSDRFMNERLSNASKNQSLAYALLAQKNPAYGYDWDSGNFYRNPKNIMDVDTDSRADIRYKYLSEQIAGISDYNERVKQLIALEKIKVFQNAKRESSSDDDYDNISKALGLFMGQAKRGGNPFRK